MEFIFLFGKIGSLFWPIWGLKEAVLASGDLG